MDLPLHVVGGLLVIFGLPGLVDVTLYPCLHLCLALSFSRPVSSSGTHLVVSLPNKTLFVD